MGDLVRAWSALMRRAVAAATNHPPVDDKPLPRSRRGLFWLMVVVFVGVFMPVPTRLTLVERAAARRPAAAAREPRRPMKVPPFEMPLEEIRASLEKLRRPLSVAVLRARNPFNVGAIIRVAHSFLVREIVLVGDEKLLRARRDGHGSLREHRRASRARPIWSRARAAAATS